MRDEPKQMQRSRFFGTCLEDAAAHFASGIEIASRETQAR
jgi:hypothetical protein